MKTLILCAVLLLVGCSDPKQDQYRREARIGLFRECMQLAAKMPRQADDDVSDVVSQCSTQAHYMTNALKK